MKSTIITLIMLMCGFTVVKAQEVIITEEEINEAIFEGTGINLNSSSSSNSNSNSKDEDADNQIYVSTEKIAEFPGGMNALFDFINRNLIYPKECISNNIEGRIMLKIIVEKDGRISAQVSESSKDRHPALIREALRLVSIMPRWTPAGYRGNSSKFINVRFQTYLPIVFRLRDGKYLPFVMPSEKSTQNKPLDKPVSFISTETFDKQIFPNWDKPIVLFFYGETAPPCYNLYKDWDTLFAKFKDKYRLYYINVTEENNNWWDLSDRYGIRNLPTLILIYNRNGDFVNWIGYGKGRESAIKSWFEDGIRKAESYFGR